MKKLKNAIHLVLLLTLMIANLFMLTTEVKAANTDGKFCYLENGEIDTTYNGVVDYKGNTWYVKNGRIDTTVNGLIYWGNAWYLFKDGKVNRITTVAQNSNGWWYVSNGQVDFAYDGVGTNGNGTWYIENGKVDFSKSGLLYRGNKWYLFNGGKVNRITTVANNAIGWWYVKNGEVDFTANTVAQNSNGWWYIKNGQVDFNYDGVGTNQNGTWYIENGKVDFSKSGLLYRGDKWYLFNGGKVNRITTVANNAIGWWYVKNGEVDFSANTVAQNANGWWYIHNGKVDFDYDGLGTNENGTWYIENGKVDFSYTGTYVYQGVTYNVLNGKATVRTSKTMNLMPYDSYYKYEYAYKNGGDISGFTAEEKAFYKGLAKCLDQAYRYKTPYEQEKAVHDYIILNCAYDQKLVSTGTVSNSEVYQAEGVFKNKVAVCDGYSKAFKLCMDILAIDCIRITGIADGGGHAWNAVKLDGEWYMVDVTWDDPVPDEPGRLIYNYFNITDEQMKRDHKYTCDIKATGTKYNYYRMQENYVTNIEDYYEYLNEAASTSENGEIITIIVESNTPWTSELLSKYMDGSKLTDRKNYSVHVSYSTYFAQFEWEFQ